MPFPEKRGEDGRLNGRQSGVGGCGGGPPKKSACAGNHNGSTQDEHQQTKEQ